MGSRKSTVKWTALERFDSAIQSSEANNYYGIYAIFETGHKRTRRKFYNFDNGSKELIYVGIVWQDHKSFRDRMKQHLRDWEVWGDGMYVKFGVVYSYTHIDRQMLEDIESAFIMTYQPSENTMKKNSFTAYDYLEITNNDPDNLFPHKIDTSNSKHIHWQ